MPRILYWNTSCLEPGLEAISKELFQLAEHFPGSRLFAVGPHHGIRVGRGGRVVGVHPRFDALLRVVIPLFERLGEISHVFAEPTPWIYYKTLRRNPLVLTIASEKGDPVSEFLERCHTIVAQTMSYARRLRDAGLPARKVRWIPPGVDLADFHPGGDVPHGEPRILFASAPRTHEEMESRGVNLLIEAARAHPEMRFRLLFRRWACGYTSLRPAQEAVRDLPNVELTNSTVGDMARVYPGYHFAVIPYTTRDGGKECPNSLVEGLACGVPALVSSQAPFADYVRSRDCGVVFDPTPERLADAVSVGMSRIDTLRQNARAAAERDFDLRGALRQYEQIYEDCLRRR